MAGSILVIDDDSAVRKAFKLALEDTAHEIDEAASGEEGIKKLSEKEYCLIFLDLKMPGISGTETLRELRKFNHTTPVYIVTAFHKEFLADLQNLRREGIKFELLRKPLGANEILELVNSILKNSTNHTN